MLFAGYFSQAQWKATHVVLGPDWGIMKLFPTWGWLYMAVELHGVEKRPVL